MMSALCCTAVRSVNTDAKMLNVLSECLKNSAALNEGFLR